MARGNIVTSRSLWRLEFFVVSLLFHLIFTWSIFDVYFHSPVVYPSRRFDAANAVPDAPWTGDAPADRLVLIVADGLRADTLFQRHATASLPSWAQHAVQGDQLVYNGTYPDAFKRTKTVDGQVSGPLYAYAAPYLRSIARGPGVFGVSHTRVPTESRPGHVALIAGMYEDMSAVTKGWKINPLAFDSLVNQSSHSYAYGSPDIVPMFVLGTSPDKVDWQVYNEEAEDFTKDAVELDTWVLHRMRDVFARAQRDPKADARLRQPKTLFFMHLLGLDTTGHTYRPMSPEYVGNTIVVDEIVRQVSHLFEDFYGDNKTAFLVTADHGMSRKGNHGDGDPDNTRTPLVAWGAGVPKARHLPQRRFVYTEYDKHWGLDFLARSDVEQADLTPLMASWLGLSVPANSEGRLPLELLNASPAYRARAALATAKQVLEVYRVKYVDRANRMLHFQPFQPLQSRGDTLPGAARVADAEQAIRDGEFDVAMEESEALIHDALLGAKYLHRYDAPILSMIVVCGYLGLFMYGLTFLAWYAQDQPVLSSRLYIVRAMYMPPLILALLWGKFALDHAPWMYFVYSGAVGAIWTLFACRVHILAHVLRHAQSMWTYVKGVSYAVISLILLELAVYGYLHRLVWAAILLFLGFSLPFASPMSFKEGHQVLVLLGAVLCGANGWFMSLPTEKDESVPLILGGGTLLLVLGSLVYLLPRTFLMPPDYLGRDRNAYAMMHARTVDELKEISAQKNEEEPDADAFWPRTRQALLMELVCLVISMLVTRSSAHSLNTKQGLPFVNQVVAWVVMLGSMSAPLVLGFQHPRGKLAQPVRERLVLLIFAFAPVFVLLSLRDEVLFYAVYTLLVLAWGHMEAELARDRIVIERITNGTRSAVTVQEPQRPRNMILDDIRVGIVYLVLLHVGFFGTGNVASISSFYLSPVYRLVPVFSPFLMAALLVLKLIVPFIILSCVLAAVCMQPLETRALAPVSSRIPIVASGLGLRDVHIPLVVAALAGDVLALNFFFAIRDEGSWLEIGQSITHFVMANLLQMYMLAIATLSALLLGVSRVSNT